LVVKDKIEANKKVAISWLLHTLSQPQADGNGLVSLERNGINLSIKPITGLPLDCRISDKFAVDINEGVPQEYHVSMPQQYHLQWDTSPAESHDIVVAFYIDGADVDIRDLLG
jgi:hypothetical protein